MKGDDLMRCSLGEGCIPNVKVPVMTESAVLSLPHSVSTGVSGMLPSPYSIVVHDGSLNCCRRIVSLSFFTLSLFGLLLKNKNDSPAPRRSSVTLPFMSTELSIHCVTINNKSSVNVFSLTASQLTSVSEIQAPA